MMKEKKELLTKFNFIFIPIVEMLQEEIQSLCNFSFCKIVQIEPANKVQSSFQKEILLVPVKHHFSYLSLHQSEWNEPKLPL
jgi:predicted nucleotide-binding protein (sugar kinase/HSP70/actin superfamily)